MLFGRTFNWFKSQYLAENKRWMVRICAFWKKNWVIYGLIFMSFNLLKQIFTQLKVILRLTRSLLGYSTRLYTYFYQYNFLCSKFVNQLLSLEAFKPKSDNSDYILYRVNSLGLGGLHLSNDNFFINMYIWMSEFYTKSD